MRYYINGREITRNEAREHLLAEMRIAEKSAYFPGRIFYNIEYIEHCARDAMRVTDETSYAYFDLKFTKGEAI